MWSLDLAIIVFGVVIAATALAWTGKLIYLVSRSLWSLYFGAVPTSLHDEAGRFGRLVLSGEALARAREALRLAEANPLLRFPACEQVVEELDHALKRLAICDEDSYAKREIHRELRNLRSHYKKKLKALTVEVSVIDVRKLIAQATLVKGSEDRS